MASPVLRRVQSLEEMMADLIRAQGRTDEQLRRTDEQLRRTDEQVERTSLEMAEFKDEMAEFREEMRRDRRNMNRRWGELANSMGTLAEDLVAPSIERIVQETLGCPREAIEFSGVRVRGRSADSSRRREVDVMVVCDDYIFVTETKSSLRVGDVEHFVETLSTIPEYYPQYGDRQVIGAIASLYVEEGVVRYAERQGLIVLGFGEGNMDVFNSEGFRPKNFSPTV